jgi:hypothetical protein
MKFVVETFPMNLYLGVFSKYTWARGPISAQTKIALSAMSDYLISGKGDLSGMISDIGLNFSSDKREIWLESSETIVGGRKAQKHEKRCLSSANICGPW